MTKQPHGDRARALLTAAVASEFNTFVESMFADTWLLFNTATGAFDVVDSQQLQRLEQQLVVGDGDDMPWMLDRGYAVPYGTDERAQVRERYGRSSRDTSRGLSVTLAPTVSCNLRCSYCFQEHPTRTFTPRDIQDLETLVRSRLVSGTPLDITWYGGEPLVAFDTMREVHARLAAVSEESGSKMSAGIITNGTLLNGERLEWLSQQDFGYVQVTVDGPSEIHDERRYTAGGKGTFDQIMGNLDAASDLLPISLRVNVDRRNAGTLPGLLAELKRRGLQNRLSVYLGHVINATEAVQDVDDNELTHEEFAKLKLEFMVTLHRSGFGGLPDVPKPVQTLCVADAPNGFVFAPGGLVFKCWNEVHRDERDAVGRMLDGKLVPASPEAEKKWASYHPFAHKECNTCLVQPLCLSGCPWNSSFRQDREVQLRDCSALRWTLADTLRLAHLKRTLQDQPDIIEREAECPRA